MPNRFYVVKEFGELVVIPFRPTNCQNFRSFATEAEAQEFVEDNSDNGDALSMISSQP